MATLMQVPENQFDKLPDIGTKPIPAGPYWEPEYFRWECEAIFRRDWIFIAHVCEVPEPGDFIVRDYPPLSASVLISRDKAGTLRAFHNVCPHRGTQVVAESAGRAARFTCSYHAWTFGQDGEFITAPDFGRFYDLNKEDCGLKPIALDVCGGMIFLNFAEKPAQSLTEFLGPTVARLEDHAVSRATHFAEYVYDIDANWKLTFDNFQELYHLRPIHPRSIGYSAMSADNPMGYPQNYWFEGPHRGFETSVNPEYAAAGTKAFAQAELVKEVMRQRGSEALANRDYFALFPNVFVLSVAILPFIHTVMPLSASRSRGSVRFYWNGADETASQRFAREYAMASARDIHAEDVDVVKSGHRGLASGALQHIHFQQQEVLCRHFIQEVNKRVRACKAERQQHGDPLPGDVVS